jgi:hypothetical protein
MIACAALRPNGLDLDQELKVSLNRNINFHENAARR